MASKKYTVTYFESPGRAEATRLAFSAAGIDFKDVRLTPEQWKDLKPSTPQGQLPMLEVEENGKKETFCQSGAMIRFVARECGLYGKTNYESTTVDVVLCTLDDIFSEIIKSFYEKDEQKKVELKTKLETEIIPKFVQYFVDIKKDKEWLAGSQMTIADISVFSLFDQLPVTFGENMVKTYFSNPSMKALSEKVAANKGIKKWLENRPKPKQN